MNPFKPLDIELRFDDREYGLGEVIDLSVTLVAGRGVGLREIAVELVCEERWSNSAYVNDRPASERSSASSEFIGYMVDRVSEVKGLYEHSQDPKLGRGPLTEVESDIDRQQTYVLGTTPLGRSVRLETGTTLLRPQVQVPSEPPPHADKAEVKWALRVTADVVWGLDTTVTVDVRII